MYEKINRKPNGSGWFDRWLPVDGEHNDWGIDRDAQRNMIHYTGINNPSMQDQAVTESMGPMTDHSFEHLAPTDQMIATVRRRLAQAVRAYRDNKAPSPCVSNPDVYFGARSGAFTADPEIDFLHAYKAELETAHRWPGSQS